MKVFYTGSQEIYVPHTEDVHIPTTTAGNGLALELSPFFCFLSVS